MIHCGDTQVRALGEGRLPVDLPGEEAAELDQVRLVMPTLETRRDRAGRREHRKADESPSARPSLPVGGERHL